MRIPTTVASIALLGLLNACAHGGIESDRIATMRQQLQTARNDPAMARYGAVALHEADLSLQQAEQASANGDAEDTDHQLYITERRLAIAQSRAGAQNAIAARQAEAQSAAQARTAQLERELEGLRARQTAQGTVFTLTDVLFETGKAQLKPGAYNRLAPLASFLKSSPDKQAVIEGFTDTRGTPERNLELSQRRAEAVRDFLVGEGIEPQRLVARGKGEDYPLASNATPAGRQQNRRVEVLVSELPPQ
jgi:outer membrane protein OmpA-like peptidoglycan-associated protein